MSLVITATPTLIRTLHPLSHFSQWYWQRYMLQWRTKKFTWEVNTDEALSYITVGSNRNKYIQHATVIIHEHFDLLLKITRPAGKADTVDMVVLVKFTDI